MMRFVKRLMLGSGLLAVALLAGCTGLGHVPPAAQRLDLGAPVPASQATGHTQPSLVVPPIAAASMLQGLSVIWRVGEDGLPNSYATYEWAAPPENLVREKLVSRLSADFAVLSASVNSDDLMLRINLMQFEQVYSQDGLTNQGVMSFQAILLQGSRVLGQYRDTVSVAGQSNDAPAGAQALRIATDQMADKLVPWIQSIRTSSK